MSIHLTSDAFDDGRPIARRYAQEGENISPPLKWSGVPSAARELALIVEDPDAPKPKPFVHWVMYKIPPTTTHLPAAIPKAAQLRSPPDAMQGINSTEMIGYDGPAPPPGHGTHHYHFRLYALDHPLTVDVEALDRAKLLAAMSGHILDEGELVGTYQR